MRDPYDDRQIRADCGHYVADPCELTEHEGRQVCQNCYEYRHEKGDE